MSGCRIIHMLEHSGPQVQGSGKVKSESRPVGSFSRIVSAGSANCRVTVGSGPSLELKADDNILPLIVTRVENGTLYIESKGSYSTRNGIEVAIKVPNLESFLSRGSGDSEIVGVRSRSFSAEIAGSGNIRGSGQADRGDYSIRGSGDMDFSNLRTKDSEASIAGSGAIELFATGTLDATIRGSGSIRYRGNPAKVNRSIAGSGEIQAG